MTSTTIAEELRSWAHGMLTLEAATELLIRGGYAEEWRPWIAWDEDRGRHWLDLETLPDQVGGMSGGEQRFLRIAASIGAQESIVVGDEICGLDRTHLQLVLAAVAHAAGMHEPGSIIAFDEGGIPEFVARMPLYSWPSA